MPTEDERRSWSQEFDALNSTDKMEFRRIANYLLSHTYLTRYQYLPSEQMTSPNRDYHLASRFFHLLAEYFSHTGWQLTREENFGYIALINLYDNNRYRMDQFTTLFLYTCRLIYEEQRENASSFHTVKSSTSEVIEKMLSLGILVKPRTTIKERLEAQRTLAHFNIIQKIDGGGWEPEGNNLLILPSILAVVPNQGINDLLREMEDFSADESNATGLESSCSALSHNLEDTTYSPYDEDPEQDASDGEQEGWV